MARLLDRLLDLLKGLPALSLTSVELLLRRPRALAYFQAEILRMRRSELDRSLPLITPRELLRARREYELRLGRDGLDLDYYPDLLLAKLVAILQPARVFEIGTHIGTSTRTIASQAPEDVEIFTLDLPPDAGVTSAMTDAQLIRESRTRLGELFLGTRWESAITQLFGDSIAFDFTPYRESIDLVYVDGSHSPAYVESDSRNAFRVVKPGGVIVWDDYGSMRSEYGTTRYLEQLLADDYPVFELGIKIDNAPSQRTGCAVLRATRELIDRHARERAA